MESYKYKLFLISFLLILTTSSFGQIGGNSVFKFLNLTSSARSAAMGGNFMAVDDGDITQALFNPSIISTKMDNSLGMSFVDYYTDVNYGFASYAKSFNNIGTYAATIQYVNYGEFTYADKDGTTYGNFTANELSANIGWGRSLDSSFSIGANFKFIYSGLEDYQSYGLAVDVAGSYHIPKNLLTMSLIARNIGTQLKPYTPGNTEPLPFELNFGISQKLKHLPFRWSVLLTNLQKWDLTYEDVYSNSQNDEEQKKNDFEDFADKAMRHVVIGGEFLPAKFFSLRFGYNYRLRKELGVSSKMSMVGFSWGIGLKISKFYIDYSRVTYHLSGSPNYITIRTSLSDFVKR